MKLKILAILAAGLLAGCAATTGGYGPAPISEGMGRLVLDAGGVPQLNFYVTDQEIDKEVLIHLVCRPALQPATSLEPR